MWRQIFLYKISIINPIFFLSALSLPLNDCGYKNHRVDDKDFRIKTFVSTSVKLWAPPWSLRDPVCPCSFLMMVRTSSTHVSTLALSLRFLSTCRFMEEKKVVKKERK